MLGTLERFAERLAEGIAAAVESVVFDAQLAAQRVLDAAFTTCANSLTELSGGDASSNLLAALFVAVGAGVVGHALWRLR